MNDAMHDRYQTYLRHLASLMLLQDWEVHVAREWADNNTYAQASVPDYENQIVVNVGEAFEGHLLTERREWLVHELLHAHFARMDRNVDRFADHLPDDQAVQLFRKVHADESEIVVQRIARLLAPHLPLLTDNEKTGY